MNIILHGSTGRMGKMVIDLVEKGQTSAKIVAKVSPEDGSDYKTLFDYTGCGDCVIDFSHHSCTSELLKYCKQHKYPVVICTTGQTTDEKNMILEASNEIPVFFSANMSLGVAVLADLVKRATQMFPNADIEIVEKHHNQKLDVPSGTALLLANSVKEVRSNAEFLIGRHENGKRKMNEVGIHSLRIGNEVGTHEVIISTGNETITLKHEAENRALFAEGALKASAFLVEREPGLYNMKDILIEG